MRKLLPSLRSPQCAPNNKWATSRHIGGFSHFFSHFFVSPAQKRSNEEGRGGGRKKLGRNLNGEGVGVNKNETPPISEWEQTKVYYEHTALAVSLRGVITT